MCKNGYEGFLLLYNFLNIFQNILQKIAEGGPLFITYAKFPAKLAFLTP